VIEGGCQCGAVRYAFEAPLPPAYCCHCDECKKQSASAFSMSVVIDFARLFVVGEPKTDEGVTYTGKPKLRFFCGGCGTRLWHRTGNSEAVTLKVGTLDDASGISPRGHLWVSRKQPWIVLDPSLPAYDTQPVDVQTWRAEL
jgi:hypothetical protein